MSWHYLQDQEAESSEACCSGGEQLPPLRSKTIHAEFYCKGKLMGSYLDSLSGTMSEPLMASHGEAKSMSSAEASPAKTSQQPEKEQELTGQDQACGHKWRELLARYDLDSHSWKTHLCLWEEDLPESSVTLPKWGIMRGGELSELTTPELHTSGTGSGSWLATPTATANQLSPSMTKHPGCVLWQTPVADDAVNRAKGKFNSRGEPKLSAQVKMFPTPYGLSANQGQGDGEFGKAIQNWPTPQASDNRDRGNMSNPSIQRRVKIGKQIGLSTAVKPDSHGGSLNPTWVEWLMNWPKNWTSLDPITEPVRLEHSWDDGERPDVPRVSKGVAHRVDRLKAIGNGQVPAAAALAWRTLTDL